MQQCFHGSSYFSIILSTFPHENGSTVPYAYVSIIWKLQKEEVSAVKTLKVLFSSLRFLITDLEDLFDIQNSRENW